MSLRRRPQDEQLQRKAIQSQANDLDAESIASGLPEGFKTNDEETKTKNKLILRTEKYLPLILNIIHGSIWGVLARKGLIVLTTYDGAYLSGVIWANFTACVVMGLFIESESLWLKLIHDDRYPNKGAIPIYAGVTTGFCGTCSSFSSVIIEAFNKSANTAERKGGFQPFNYPNSAYGIMEFLAVILAQFGLSIMAFHMGKHLATLIDQFIPSFDRKFYKIIETISILLGGSIFIVIIVLIGVESTWRSWTFSMFFAPFAALLRFYLSKYLNNKIANFPFGTFTANILGTLLLSIFTLLDRGYSSNGGRIINTTISCQVLSGLDDGFCGALTTVSTFVAELFGLKTLYSYRYGITSIMISYAVTILILGSFAWTHGLTNSLC
ncbi:unnamed protein product [Candida verbasci]|uniref:Uncharacterized protein n=1 Tax=Candida verbasci TaxID=1227364 RepID=A0A9W4U0C3_9ASCO|nr:unnamed protein product [Candida verbasci]